MALKKFAVLPQSSTHVLLIYRNKYPILPVPNAVGKMVTCLTHGDGVEGERRVVWSKTHRKGGGSEGCVYSAVGW